jgi:hypothetical protein
MINDEKYFIDKNKILEKYHEAEIFSIIFGTTVETGLKYKSPFRDDENPNCFFEYDKNNRLIFYDYAAGINYDCFQAIKIYFTIPNFYQVLALIRDNMLDIKEKNILTTFEKKEKTKKAVKLYVKSTEYTQEHVDFFKTLFIKRKELEEDFVYPVSEALMLNTKKGNLHFKFNSIAFCINFRSGRKKIYLPKTVKNPKRVFISNQQLEDIGGEEKIDYEKRTIIITKSYIDYKVIYNLGYNVIWLMSEGAFPNKLLSILEKFENIYIIFDNDDPGILATNNLIKFIRDELNKKANFLFMPFGKDPSGFLRELKKLTKFEEFFKTNIIN